MIDGTGFFIVGPYRDAVDNIQEVEGENTEGQFNIANSGMLLSRVGIFTPDANGYLVDDSGNYVFGYIPDNQTPNENNVVPMNYDNLVPIRIPVNEETGEMYSISSWRIGQSGTIIGTATNGDIVTIGQIAVASVENPNGLNQKTGYYYEVGNNAGRCIAMQTTAATGNINSGFLEMSNTDIASDFAAMITTQRGYQANTKIITVTDEILEQLVNMKR